MNAQGHETVLSLCIRMNYNSPQKRFTFNVLLRLHSGKTKPKKTSTKYEEVGAYLASSGNLHVLHFTLSPSLYICTCLSLPFSISFYISLCLCLAHRTNTQIPVAVSQTPPSPNPHPSTRSVSLLTAHKVCSVAMELQWDSQQRLPKILVSHTAIRDVAIVTSA